MIELTDLPHLIFEKIPWEERFDGVLRQLKLDEPKKAWEIFSKINLQANFKDLYPTFFPSLFTSLKNSYKADTALNNFDRLTEKIVDKEHLYSLLTLSPEFLKTLITLFSGSQVLTDTLLSNPSYIDWLSQDGMLTVSKTKNVLYREFYQMAGVNYSNEQIPSLLRKFKKREYIRIGLRDLMGLVTLKENVGNLSDLADICLQIACDYSEKVLKKKFGTPFYEGPNGEILESEFTVLSMGKLGGRELNYSSDIDLIYIYSSSMGETQSQDPGNPSISSISNHEYHTKFARLVTQTINEITSEGNVFRVDLDLRPEGKSGEIVNSLTSCEIYYQSWGRTWERQALIKARVSAGSENLGEEFFTMIRPFIYRKSLDFNAIEEIKSLKKKVDLDLKKKKLEKGHIKLGPGGIREVEFIVQAYQLLFGGQDIQLREANTLNVLKKLRDREFLNEEEYFGLKEAYIFLRNLENRVQISFGLQTYHLPKNETDLAVLARKMGLNDSSNEALILALNTEFERHTDFVAKMFANLFSEDKDQKAADHTFQKWDAQKNLESRFDPELLKDFNFNNSKRTFSFLQSLRDGPKFSHPSERSIRDFYSMLPTLLEICKNVPNPNSAIENLVKFVEASQSRDAFLALFNENEKFLELLLILFGGSEVLSQLLVKRPYLIDVLSNPGSIYRFKTPEEMTKDLDDALQKLDGLNNKNVFLRKFKNGEELRIGIKYLIGETGLPETLADLSNLADIYLKNVLSLALTNKSLQNSLDPIPHQFAIIGLGKLGGQELNFGSDLDIVFVYEENEEFKNHIEGDIVSWYSSLAQNVYQLSTEMTSEGLAYKIDTDLRPEGSRGALVISLNGYKDYFKNRGQIWEQQAMTRARFVAGNPDVGKKFIEIVQEFSFPKKFEYDSLIEIARLRERMEKEIGQEVKKGKNVKLGFGGLADIEFLVQILQMMNGHRYPKLRETNVFHLIQILSSYGILPYEQGEELGKNYHFLRNLECALRLLNPRYSNYLPKDKETLGVLGRMLSFPGNHFEEQGNSFMEEYLKVTKKVRTLYRDSMDTFLRTAL